jgi:hypothetical protein
MDEAQKGLAENAVPETKELVSPPDDEYDYSTEKQLDDRVHTISPLDPATQAPEVVPEASHTNDEKDPLSAASTVYSTEKQLDGKKDGISHSKTDDTQISSEKQHMSPLDEDASPKYSTPREDQPELEHISNAVADAPEPFVGCTTIEPEGNENLQSQSRNQRPPADETSWHFGFLDCFTPASLCMFALFRTSHDYG